MPGFAGTDVRGNRGSFSVKDFRSVWNCLRSLDIVAGSGTLISAMPSSISVSVGETDFLQVLTISLGFEFALMGGPCSAGSPLLSPDSSADPLSNEPAVTEKLVNSDSVSGRETYTLRQNGSLAEVLPLRLPPQRELELSNAFA